MPARKRRDDETFENYRHALKQEGIALKAAEKGTMWWHGSKGTMTRNKKTAKKVPESLVSAADWGTEK